MQHTLQPFDAVKCTPEQRDRIIELADEVGIQFFPAFGTGGVSYPYVRFYMGSLNTCDDDPIMGEKNWLSYEEFVSRLMVSGLGCTPGPWRFGKTGDSIVSDSAQGLNVHGVGDLDQLDYYGGNLIAESVTRANAARIIACVNAFEGVEDPEEYMKQVGLYKEMPRIHVQQLEQEIVRLREEIAELRKQQETKPKVYGSLRPPALNRDLFTPDQMDSFSPHNYQKRRVPNLYFTLDYSVGGVQLFLKGEEYPHYLFNYGRMIDMMNDGILSPENPKP